MVPVNRRVKKRSVPNLEADRSEYLIILQDMVDHGGALIPDPNWLRTDDKSRPAESYDKADSLEVALSEQHYRAKVSKLEQLMKAWIGATDPPTHRDISRYRLFLANSDVLGLWSVNMEQTAQESVPLARQDLGSLMDLNLIYAFSAPCNSKRTTVLEVGGGYGRLAEAMFNVFGKSIQYVILDAVPASLYYANKYLRYACPDARVISYYDGGDIRLNSDSYDIAIVPAWHFDRYKDLCFDVCVNIESMQEMNQHHVDHYLELFQSVSKENTIFYLSNARSYYFRGEFKYPKNWEKLLCANTPRSWTLDHPTEIFRKTNCDRSLQNAVCDAVREYRVWLESDVDELVNRNGIFSLSGGLIRAISNRISSRFRRAVRKS